MTVEVSERSFEETIEHALLAGVRPEISTFAAARAP